MIQILLDRIDVEVFDDRIENEVARYLCEKIVDGAWCYLLCSVI